VEGWKHIKKVEHRISCRENWVKKAVSSPVVFVIPKGRESIFAFDFCAV
jgi:hypothetical protein